jgi:hypothetical protein
MINMLDEMEQGVIWFWSFQLKSFAMMVEIMIQWKHFQQDDIIQLVLWLFHYLIVWYFSWLIHDKMTAGGN